jgi:hypothetical protein
LTRGVDLFLQFSEPVTVGADALTITGPLGQPVTTSLTLVLTNDGSAAGVRLSRSLADGNYVLVLNADRIKDAAGNELDGDLEGTGGGDQRIAFFQFIGDSNRDRAVDFKDLVKLAQSYNTTGKTWGDGDFTGDGAVDFNDLVVLAQRYNTSLAAPGASSPAAAPAASFAADWAAVMASMGAPTATWADPKQIKLKPIFSIAPVAMPALVKPKARQWRRR